MNRLNEIEKKYIINLIENGEQIPEDYNETEKPEKYAKFHYI